MLPSFSIVFAVDKHLPICDRTYLHILKCTVIARGLREAIPSYLCDLEKVCGAWITVVWTDKERGKPQIRLCSRNVGNLPATG